MLRAQKPKINPWLFRPFEKEDFVPVPDDWIIGPPGFVGIASGKAGTSWWYRLLLEHPSIQPNRLPRKELSYFYHFGYQGISEQAIETYNQAFAAPPGSLSGEWSPGYLTFPLAIDYLAKTVRNTKLLAIVRNPVDRFLSAINQKMQVRSQALEIKSSAQYLFHTFSIYPEVALEGLLSAPFRRLLSFFDRSQLLLLQYEKCKSDPAGEISKTYRFLGVDETYVPASLNRKINTRPSSQPELARFQRRNLANYFKEDVENLMRIFPEIDLTLWPDFLGASNDEQ